ncbi:MAG TPA: prepilin peptidase [Bryobacteraceae bacterium]|nr:prepilin peptidase [Bryobacteraceae bacterium]
MEPIAAFLVGLLIGSFLNVCIYRLPRDLSIVGPRSVCPHCKRKIAWYDNIPLLSYVLLRARCRFCLHRIPMRYPLVELANGIAFALCVGELGVSLPAVKWSIFSALLLALIATDLEQRILPDELTLGGTLLGVALSLFVPLDSQTITLLFAGMNWRAGSLMEAAFGAAIASAAIWFVGWAYQKLRRREGLGLGDVKMIALMGAFLGAPNALLAIAAGSAFGAVVSLLYIRFAGKDASTYQLPFGSFLGVGALAVAFAGEVAGRGLLSS